MVLADGCFDPIHIGHIAYFKAASEFGRPLMVRVAGDSAIFEKGRVPFQDQPERLVTVMNIAKVDGVCAAPTLAEAILKYKPTHLVKGQDWQGKLPEDVVAACLQVGAQMVFVNTQARTSSERLLSS